MKPSAIAIVGMAGRFPGAINVGEFWRNLRNGVESIRSLSDAELLAAGVSAQDLARSDYVRRASVLDDVDMFDAAFFGLSPNDAAIMDPQHRHFLECAWEALEDAAHPPQLFTGSIGVFAGSGMNTYLIHNLLANRKLVESAGLFQLKQTGNDKDVLSTRVSYQFDLRGPSINVQTACSTSLVAVHLACQSLLNHECDMALAGGVTIEIPHGQGYIHREGEILSEDGHCRSFDAAATGTIFASGVGVVVLRRLEDAVEDLDAIRAVILGSAINNDGARKVGYLAPSVDGQAEVIAEALEFAGVSADDITYIEAHGTGTLVGDPIEVRALTKAFRRSSERVGYCAIGSLKSNVGHLDAAAGVAGLIKTVLALEHAQLPASLNFSNPNPHIEFQGSPFFVNRELADWPSDGSPRRAGVTSLGIGGTNAHVVLEEAPRMTATGGAKPCHLFTVSAKTESAADRAVENLIAYLDVHPDVSLADASFTSQVGRHGFLHRRAWVMEDTRKAISELARGERQHIASGVAANSAPQVAFMFSGQGAQHVNMGRELYEHEPVFREAMEACAGLLLATLGLDLRTALYPAGGQERASAEKLNETWLAQPALFAIEYSLARWWMSLGVEPVAMVGYSIGEYVAACLAGVFSLEDALMITALRGRMLHELPAGAMRALPLSTAMMGPILDAFEERLRSISYQAPLIPYLSNITGTWIKAEEACDAAYWARHLRGTVRFSDCIGELLRKPNLVLIEVGPGNTLTSLARQQSGAATKAFQSLPHEHESGSALRSVLHAVGKLWTLGVHLDWTGLHVDEAARRVPLPTYPFEHQRFWVEPDGTSRSASSSASLSQMNASGGVLFYRRLWKSAPPNAMPAVHSGCWMIFNDSIGLGIGLAQFSEPAARTWFELRRT